MFGEAVLSLQAEAAAYSDGVTPWLRILQISFFSGIIFVIADRRAALFVGIMILTALMLILGKVAFPHLSRTEIATVSHLILWPIALLGLWQPENLRLTGAVTVMARLFNVWKYWVTGLVVVSLYLDLRTLLGWF